jgi:phage terminase small subunit
MGLNCRIVTNPTYLFDGCMEIFRKVWDFLKVHEISIESQNRTVLPLYCKTHFK